ncbi:MAG: hypothetical protein J5939_08280 [Bacteroidales bacterium]|nr:hypothetical protein [Bacteroidales bacterium]
MILTALISLFCALAPEDTVSVLDKSAERLSPVLKAAVPQRSAAAGLFGPYRSYTSAAVRWDGRREGSALLPQEGDGHDEGQVDIRTLVRLDTLSAVTGTVEYINGLKRNVRWNTSSDFLTVFPYILADSVGGNLRKEQYAFSGGYSSRKGWFHYGVTGAYRALHEYRNIDPRPRNIVSDLSVTATAGLRILPGYRLDASASYRRYSQSQNVEFYNQRGANTVVFHLTGLGSQYTRFASTSVYTTTRYAGNGGSVALDFFPERTEGWRAALSCDLFDVIHHLPSQNEAPYTELLTRTGNVRAGYVARRKTVSWQGGLHASVQGRQGIEDVIDNGSSGHMMTLIRFSMYQSLEASAGVSGAVEWKDWAVEGDVSYRHFSASCQYPARSLGLDGMDLSASAARTERKGAWLLRGVLQAHYVQAFGGNLSLPRETLLPALDAFYGDMFDRWSRSSAGAGVSLRAERALAGSPVSVFGDLSGRGLWLFNGKPAIYYSLTIGFSF